MELAPYLNFDGSCREAFQFYATLLGGTVIFMQTFGESPMTAPPGWGDKVMHATIAVGSQRLMGSDAPPQRYNRPQGTYVSMQLTSRSEGERIFQALSDGGQVEMPFSETFWSPGFGMVVDRYGIPWMINVNTAQA